MTPDTQDMSAQQVLEDARRWWTTSIIDIEPGRIAMRGYPIEQLIGRVGFAEMVWLMLRGELPSPQEAALLEATLVASVDHGPHAPSIAISRMATSCGLPVNGAMASAINALDDVHGGAGQQCMSLMARIDAASTGEATRDTVERVLDDWIAEHGKIIPGFGHRWHPVDPRSPRLLDLVDAAAKQGVIHGRFASIGRLIEQVMTARKGVPIPMNIDGATAVIHSELGFRPELGRGLFILSRSVGILAHAVEQAGQGARIKGPMSPLIPYTYDGPARRDLPQAG